MQFIQYSQKRIDNLAGCIALPPACLICLYFTLRDGQEAMSCLVAVVMLAAFAFCLRDYREEKHNVIQMDENGISLTHKEQLQWQFAWAEIERVGSKRKFHRRTIWFVPKNLPDSDTKSACAPFAFEFHLNKTAKEALARYCPLPVER